ncbi:MAG: hypothetical protein KGN74_03750 [Gemmatimonadota bacterium]|nr:hypothetical protein [Gemmatimonadota bacterium]
MSTDRLLDALRTEEIETPAFVYDEAQLAEDARLAREAIRGERTHLLFAMKSFAVPGGLRVIAPFVDGFHASSLFEARLARDVLGWRGVVHLTSPGIRPADADDLFHMSDHVSFNSLTQWEQFRDRAGGVTKCGLRVNPRLSNVADERYDPCSRHSKLGANVEEIRDLFARDPGRLEGLTGLLFHTNCDAFDTTPVLETVLHLDRQLGPLLERMSWIDLGGGYLFHGDGAQQGIEARLPWQRRPRRWPDLDGLHAALDLLRSRYRLDIYLEPGASISRRAGTFVSSVVDLFQSSGRDVAVLDTTVNHMPEVIEFQFAPDVLGDLERGGHHYLLAGATCLAGDVLGEYAFDAPLAVGSRVFVPDMGAYSIVKANMFNGVNLPNIYSLHDDGTLTLERAFNYEDFLTRSGGGQYVHS